MFHNSQSILKITKSKIWPTETLQLNFGNDTYKFCAEGKVNASHTTETENGNELFQEMANWILYLM